MPCLCGWPTRLPSHCLRFVDRDGESILPRSRGGGKGSRTMCRFYIGTGLLPSLQ
jgi:hypothetical protein